VKPYYEHAGIAVYNGNALDAIPQLEADVMVTDPPYGVKLSSSMGGRHGDCAIVGDCDQRTRDEALRLWGTRAALVFGSWKVSRPEATRAVLIWEKGEHVGMGDLELPWKPNHEEIYVLGSGFCGKRTGSVLRYLAIAGCVGLRTSRFHPTEKPVDLMTSLLEKCPASWVVLDPFMGSGTTLVAAKNLGRRAVGIEIEERYCEIAAKRLSQEVFDFREMKR
jgi:DNA modification methylase